MDLAEKGRRRRTDPEHEDHMAERGMDEELRLGWGDKSLSARGLVVIVVVLQSVALGGLIYFHGIQTAGALQVASREHSAIAQEIRIQTCVQSLSFDERKVMRETARYSGQDVMRAWCPWMLELDKR